MFITQLRKVRGGQAVIVPKDELARLGIPQGATVSVEVREVEVTGRPVMPRHLRDAAERALAWGEPGLRYLADNH